eukprot:UN05760
MHIKRLEPIALCSKCPVTTHKGCCTTLKYYQIVDRKQLKIFDKTNYLCYFCFTGNKSKAA